MFQRLLARLLTVASLAVAVTTGAYAATSESCQRVQFSPERPGWTNSGAWAQNGDLLVADSLRKQILRYSKAGRVLGRSSGKAGDSLGSFSPQILHSAGGNRMVAEGVGGFLIVTDGDTASQRVDIPTQKSYAAANGAKIGALSLWEPVGNSILAFSTLTGPGPQDYSLGIISFPLSKPQDVTFFQPELKYTESLSNFYRLGHHYITSLDGAGYILFMESKMSILRAKDGKLKDINVFPAELNIAPQLPSFTSKSDLPFVMRAVENSTMPTGLYGWGHSLYVLWRRPEGGRTHWFLTRIDPDDEGKAPKTISIKTTSASHLTVVPGPDAWAFIEKGPVRDWGLQSINSILMVPAARLRSAFRSGGDLCN